MYLCILIQTVFNSFISLPDSQFYNAQDFHAHGYCVSVLSEYNSATYQQHCHLGRGMEM